MKKVMLLLSMLFILFGISSCENEKIARLRASVDEANSQCPISMGMLGDLTSLYYNDGSGNVEMVFTVDDQLVSIDALRRTKDSSMTSFKLGMTTGASRNVTQMIVDAGAGLEATFKNLTGSDSMTISLSPDELKDALDNPMPETESNRIIVENQINTENSRCPYTVDEGMTMTKVFRENNDVVYCCTFDEDLYDVDLLRQNTREIKEEMGSIFDDPVAKYQLRLYKSLGYSLVYRYVGDTSGRKADIRFSPAEFSRYL